MSWAASSITNSRKNAESIATVKLMKKQAEKTYNTINYENVTYSKDVKTNSTESMYSLAI